LAEIRPFRALRYDRLRVTPNEVVAPPYDIVSAEDIVALHARSPYNAAHIENPAGEDDGRFQRAAEAIAAWQTDGMVLRDEAPALYVYEQVTQVQGEPRVRRCVFAAVRLHEPDEGVIRFHESTMAGPRAERLQLLRTTRTQISPIFSMFTDPQQRARRVLDAVAEGEPVFDAADALGDRHRLWVLDDAEGMAAVADTVAASNITIADGHHRTHTALDYRREVRAERGAAWSDDDAEAFVLMGLVPDDDPGLTILPAHRLVHTNPVPEGFLEALGELYEVELIAGDPDAATAEAWRRVQANAGGTMTFAVLGAEHGRVHLATARDQAALEAALPSHLSEASRGLDAVVLTETILSPLLGIDADVLGHGDRVDFTADVEQVRRRVASEHRTGFLLNATTVQQVVDVCDRGEVMPPKTTYFYPKLATGMVFYAFKE
jgi:uncharacterized protein (DUF1015 family)